MKKDKKPLTTKAIRELQQEVQNDPSLIREFVEDFEKVLESRGYYMTRDFQKKMDKELEKKVEDAWVKVPRGRLSEKLKRKEPIKIKVKLNKKTNSKKIKIL